LDRYFGGIWAAHFLRTPVQTTTLVVTGQEEERKSEFFYGYCSFSTFNAIKKGFFLHVLQLIFLALLCLELQGGGKTTTSLSMF
jgi:hypothetical protein